MFVAKRQAVQILAASAETPDSPYLAFPAILDLGTEVLVSFKHGRSHAGDADATLDWMRYDKASSRKLPLGTLAAVIGETMQMGEWVRCPNGDIANYIDTQKPKVLRTGLAVVRSTDGGRTFGPVQRVGLVDGLEYGYAFDAITRHVVLDTAKGQSPEDSFYAQPFRQERDGRTRLHLITYKGGSGPGLDIVRFEFDWEEVR